MGLSALSAFLAVFLMVLVALGDLGVLAFLGAAFLGVAFLGAMVGRVWGKFCGCGCKRARVVAGSGRRIAYNWNRVKIYFSADLGGK